MWQVVSSSNSSVLFEVITNTETCFKNRFRLQFVTKTFFRRSMHTRHGNENIHMEIKYCYKPTKMLKLLLSPLLQIKKNYMALFTCKALSILTTRFHWVLFSFFPWYVGRDSLARVLLQSTSTFSVYFLQTSSKPSSSSQTVTSLRIWLGRLGRSWLKRCRAGRSSDRWDFHTAMRPSRDPGPEITSPSSVRHIERTRSWWRDNSWNKGKWNR